MYFFLSLFCAFFKKESPYHHVLWWQSDNSSLTKLLLYQVTVGNLTFAVGQLRYEEPEVLSFPAIIAIAVSGSILLVILVIVCVLYRVKSRRSDDMMKKMRIQMDMLEARVANECKEGVLYPLLFCFCWCCCCCLLFMCFPSSHCKRYCSQITNGVDDNEWWSMDVAFQLNHFCLEAEGKKWGWVWGGGGGGGGGGRGGALKKRNCVMAIG